MRDTRRAPLKFYPYQPLGQNFWQVVEVRIGIVVRCKRYRRTRLSVIVSRRPNPLPCFETMGNVPGNPADYQDWMYPIFYEAFRSPPYQKKSIQYWEEQFFVIDGIRLVTKASDHAWIRAKEKTAYEGLLETWWDIEDTFDLPSYNERTAAFEMLFADLSVAPLTRAMQTALRERANSFKLVRIAENGEITRKPGFYWEARWDRDVLGWDVMASRCWNQPDRSLQGWYKQQAEKAKYYKTAHLAELEGGSPVKYDFTLNRKRKRTHDGLFIVGDDYQRWDEIWDKDIAGWQRLYNTASSPFNKSRYASYRDRAERYKYATQQEMKGGSVVEYDISCNNQPWDTESNDLQWGHDSDSEQE